MRENGSSLETAETVWVCACCGQRAKTRRGIDDAGKSTVIDLGYDSSCASQAVLCYTAETGTWVALEPSPNENNMHAAGGNDE
jgi:hypothetical protein